MIYLKKPDGTIQQFEDDMRQALNIDKEIQGESFGEIYTSESLPDEDKVKLGLMTQNELDVKINLNRIAVIKSALANIDNQTIRPLRATMSGFETVDDIKKLTILEKQANSLREELKQLEI